MDIKRRVGQSIIGALQQNKIILLYGARQVGKTTLAQTTLSTMQQVKILQISADEKRYRDILSSQDAIKLQSLVGNADIVFIDEAQRVSDIGLNLKILYESLPKVQFIVTGSSSFDLANKTREPLTGRTISFKLFPLSIAEISNHYSNIDIQSMLDTILIYGLYPAIFTQKDITVKYSQLKELAESYIYKDVLNFGTVKNIEKIGDLLRLLAFQVGSQVSITELAGKLSMNKDTVEKYISILEEAFIIFRLRGFSGNLRNEITKMDKIYFYDNGIRNIIINNIEPLNLRNDVGQLWENFLVSERLKCNTYANAHTQSYFWRTYTKVEIDYVEKSGETLCGYEFKYNTRKLPKTPKTWSKNYPSATYSVITPENFWDFVF